MIKPRTTAALAAIAASFAIMVATKARALDAVASFTILADMVHQVGGDGVRVTSLVGPNGDPHAFVPTPQDARRIRAADIVFVNGLGLEGWMDRLIAASGYEGDVIVTSEGTQKRDAEENGKQILDPHAWNSAANGVVYVQNIVRALSVADPTNAATYEANGKRYANELRALDSYARAATAAIPKARRKVLTSHDALGYFGNAYGVTLMAPVGFSTDSEASAEQVAKLIDRIKAEGVKVYFVENSNDPRLVEQIARATGAQPGGKLYVEALSEPNGPAPTYAAMFRYDLDLVLQAMLKD